MYNIIWGNDSITADELVKFLVWKGALSNVCSEAFLRKRVFDQARDWGLTVTDDELQKFADHYRIAHGLFSTQETQDFFQKNGVTEDDFELYCESSLLMEAIKNHLATEEKVQEYFYEKRCRFDRAVVSIMEVDNPELAKEIMMQVAEDGEDFHRLACQYSLDEMTKASGGYLGVVFREAFPPEEEAKVFNAPERSVVGPFERNGHSRILYVEKIVKDEFNSMIKEIIKTRIFDEWKQGILSDAIRVETGGSSIG